MPSIKWWANKRTLSTARMVQYKQHCHLKLQTTFHITKVWNEAHPTLSDSQLIKQWPVCQMILNCHWQSSHIYKTKASNNVQQSSNCRSSSHPPELLKLRQSRYLSYHSMSEQSSIIWGVGKRVGTRGTRKPSLAGPNQVPPLPHLHTSRNSIKKLESKVTVFRKLLKEKRETNPVVTYCICFDMDL